MRQRGFDPAQDLEEKSTREEWHQHLEDVRAPTTERAGSRARTIAEPFHSGQHPLARGLFNEWVVVEDARYRPNANSCRAGNIVDGGWHHTSLHAEALPDTMEVLPSEGWVHRRRTTEPPRKEFGHEAACFCISSPEASSGRDLSRSALRFTDLVIFICGGVRSGSCGLCGDL